jgi:hypothetical protein
VDAEIFEAEHAVELAWDIAWDRGAPTPFLVSEGGKAAVVFYLKDSEQLGVVEFHGVYEVRFGGLNDEAIEGHPLWDKGLAAYAAHEVIHSKWITESERRNSVHRSHKDGWHDRLKHYVLCFHDQTLECLASEIHVARFTGSYREAVRSVVSGLLR